MNQKRRDPFAFAVFVLYGETGGKVKIYSRKRHDIPIEKTAVFL